MFREPTRLKAGILGARDGRPLAVEAIFGGEAAQDNRHREYMQALPGSIACATKLFAPSTPKRASTPQSSIDFFRRVVDSPDTMALLAKHVPLTSNKSAGMVVLAIS